jgi:protein-S-isoprenylcysteine O-methyltransferase Ste14
MARVHLPTNVSRSTPRVRLMALAIAACILAVAVSERQALTGAAAVLAGLAGFACVAVAALGRLWTSLFIAGFKDTSLVQSGPYAACRHPLYALSLLGMLGLGLATRSITLSLALLVTAVVLHSRAMRAEDAALAATHGEAALRYREAVPSLLPDFSKYRVPETLEIRPRVVWKAVLDAGTLLLAFAAIQVAHVLQVAGVTATWLRLP